MYSRVGGSCFFCDEPGLVQKMIDGRVQVQAAQRPPLVWSGSVQKFGADPGVGPEFEPVLISNWNWIHRKKSPWISFFPVSVLEFRVVQGRFIVVQNSGRVRFRKYGNVCWSGRVRFRKFTRRKSEPEPDQNLTHQPCAYQY